METRGHILVIKLGALGDFIQALGPMAAIRAAHPNDKITLLTTKPFGDIARASGYADSIILDTRPKWYDLTGWLSLKAALNKGRFTRVYDLQNNDRTAIYLKLFSPRPEWVGAAPGASHRNASPARTAGKAFTGHVQTLAMAGIHNVAVDDLEWLSPQTTFALEKPYVLIVPGGSSAHPEKRWPIQSYIALCNSLVENKIHPVLIGSKTERDVTDAIARSVPEAVNLTGQTALFDLAALARGAYAAIGNDTGPMHLIGPTGCRTLVLFSHKSDPLRHAPLGANVRTLQKKDLKSLPVQDVWTYFCDQFSLL